MAAKETKEEREEREKQEKEKERRLLYGPPSGFKTDRPYGSKFSSLESI